jgi:ABC-type nitrate/sulfonate/bicarbonate transport system ATPase subunit
VREYTHAHDRLTIMVTHDVVEALRTGDRIVTLAGTPARIISEEVVKLPERERDPRTEAFQREAARLYDVLLSAR